MREHLIKPLVGQQYPMISHGSGIYLYDQQGKRYIDGSSGAITASIGHGVEKIIQAMTRQAEQVAFVYRSQFTSEAAEELAKKLSEKSLGDVNWSFFVNSGTEAMETAMKIAIQHYQEQGRTSKQRIISRHMSYHGITIGALSMSGHPLRRYRFTSLLEDYPTISPPYCFRCPFGLEHPSCQTACATQLAEAIERIGAEHIAAFVAEPIIGAAGGAITPPPEYYPIVKRICEQYDILFIADEVMTGIGRTGTWFAMEHWGVTPDIIATGKGLTAGYTPMAATMVSDRVMEPILQGSKLVMSGHTFSANPLSAAVSLAVLEYVEEHDLLQNATNMGAYLLRRLRDFQEEFPSILDVRGKGLLLGLELSIPSARVIQAAAKHGLLLYPAVAGRYGKDEKAVLIAPPLTISHEQIDELLQLLYASLKAAGGV